MRNLLHCFIVQLLFPEQPSNSYGDERDNSARYDHSQIKIHDSNICPAGSVNWVKLPGRNVPGPRNADHFLSLRLEVVIQENGGEQAHRHIIQPALDPLEDRDHRRSRY